MTLSDAKIRNLKPKPKTYKVADIDGLYIAVNPSGSKLWRFKYRLGGKEKLLSIGVYPAISLAQARQARDAARAAVAAGTDPSEAKQEDKRIRRESQGHTFEKVGAAFLEKQRKEGKSPATLSKTEYHLKLANKDFGRKPISEITSPMVLRCLRKVEAKGNYETAHRLRARIGSIFRYAVASGIVESEMLPTVLKKSLKATSGREIATNNTSNRRIRSLHTPPFSYWLNALMAAPVSGRDES